MNLIMSHNLSFSEGLIYEININNYPNNYCAVLFGYIAPPLIVATIVINVFFVSILLRKELRTISNIILSSMAISDILTGLSYLPVFIYFYSMGNHNKPVSLEWCKAFNYMDFNFPCIFHTASVWLTVSLVIQRYVFVKHNSRTKRLITVNKTYVLIGLIYLFAVLPQLSFFIDSDFILVQGRLSQHSNQTFQMCKMEFKPFFMENFKTYINLYYWFRIVFISLIPGIILIVLNLLLVSTIKIVETRRRLLLNGKNNHDDHDTSTCTHTRPTLMIVSVVGLFLLAEIPYVVLYFVQSIQFTFEINLIDYKNYLIALKTAELFMFACFPVDFFIYCGMSHKFRETIKYMFHRRHNVQGLIRIENTIF